MHSGHLLAASCAKGEVVRKTQREQQALPAWQWTQLREERRRCTYANSACVRRRVLWWW